ncbi:hypothetical protein RhiirA4_405637 [Rhizophagus irregularis]|uniref:HMG box domain-containing protein n=1 Tax=Rhizophagus irregularis TaxID=588596 RepID=A0A2I1GSJ6_9GLOM|nr:hypothetical protein RhiirA4_405637 [Rhizophagus irregularis]
MSLDEYDGSDMELDSDSSSERYYNYKDTAAHNLCSKSSNFSIMNENKDKLLDNDRNFFSTSLSPQSENGSLQSSNNRSDHINEFGTKPSVNSTVSSKKISCAQPQPPSPPFNFQGSKLPSCPLPENTMNNLSKTFSSPPLSNTSSQVTLSTSSKQTNGFFLKSSMNKSPTNNNVNNEPTKLEKHDKIKFELKSTGYKNRLLSQADKQSFNTSAKNIFKLSNNVDMMNANDTNLVKESTFMNKSSSLPAKVSNLFYIKSEKDNKRVIDDRFKEGVKNHVAEEKQSHKQVIIENPLGKSDVNTIVVKKDLNKRSINSSKIIKKYSAIVKRNFVQQNQLFNNNSTNENSGKISEKQQEQVNDKIDDNNLTLLVKDSVVLKKGQDPEKNQFDNNDPKIQEIVQKEQAENPKDIFQNTEVQLKNVDVVEKPVDLIQNLTRDDAVNKINNNEVQVMDIDNDDNKSTEYPSLSTINTEEDKNDIMELDQVNMSEQDHKNKDENITSKMDIIEKSEEASEKMENEKEKNDELETQVSPKIKDKGKKVAISADKVTKTTNQADASSSKPTETEMTSQEPETSHTDLLTNLMTQFTNQINETSRQTNQYNVAETQSNEIQRPFNHIIRPTDQSTSHVTQSPQPVKKMDKVEKVEEIINFSDLSKEIVEKYHKLDNLLLEFDEITKKAVNAYDELQRLLPEGTVIKIDPPTTYKWDMIANMLGIADMNRQDDNENKGKNNSDEEKANLENGENAREVETSSEIEFDEEDMDVPSDDPDDKNFKCRSTILKQPNPKRWHNTRSNRPPSANLRQRTKVDPDSSNISTTPTTSNSPSKKKQSQTSSKRTLRTRKGEDEGDDITTTSNPQKHLDLDKYYEDGRPRRPANGFSFFCGDMCAKVRNEKLPISGTIAYAAEIWKKMSNEEKRPWLERGEKSKSEYQDLLIRWKEEQEELKNSGVKRTVSPKATSVFSYKKPRNDEHK